MAELVLTPEVAGAVALRIIVTGSTHGSAIWIAEGADGLKMPTVLYETENIESPDTEGGFPIRSREQVPEGGGKVYLSADTDAEFSTLLDSWQQTIQSMRQSGGTILYVDPVGGGADITYRIPRNGIAFTTLNQDIVIMRQRMAESEWMFHPFPAYGELAEITDYPQTDSDPFNRDTLAEGRWLFDAGAGTLVAHRENGVTNPKAAVDTTGWTNNGLGTFNRVTLPSGVVSILSIVEPDIATAFRGVGNSSADGAWIGVPVVSGRTYRFSAYVYLDTNSSSGVRLQVHDAADVAKANSITLSTLDVWTRLDVEFTADATGTWRFYGGVQQDAGATDFYWTATLVEETAGSFLGDYFDGDTPTGRWAGAANASVSQTARSNLAPFTITTKTLYRSIKTSNATVTIKMRTGTSVATDWKTNPVLRRLDGSNMIYGLWGNDFLGIYKLDGGSETNLSGVGFTAVANTDYWVQFQTLGNVLTARLFTSNPFGIIVPSPVATTTHTLTGGDATKFGIDIFGNPGLRLTPKGTDYRYDDWRLDASEIRSSEPLLDFEVRNVPGSASALVEHQITDKAGRDRSHVEWGREDKNYDHLAPWPLLIDSDQLVTTGFAGVQTTRTGAYDPLGSGNNVIRATLTTTPVTVCGSGPQMHIGVFRHKPRVFGSGTGLIYIRLAYKTGSSPRFKTTDWIALQELEAFYEVDLGLMQIPPAVLGVQTCEWRIEAYSQTAGDTLDVDYDQLIPGPMGKARAPLVIDTPTSFSARSEFDTESGAITGDALATGGTWLGSGDADDFSVVSAAARRTAVSDAGGIQNGRLMRASTPNLSALDVRADVRRSTVGVQGRLGILFRYVDPSNFMAFYFDAAAGDLPILTKRVGGVTTEIANFAPTGGGFDANEWWTLRARADAAGRVQCWAAPQGTPLDDEPHLETIVAEAVAGQALDDGQVGIVDQYETAGASNRDIDNFVAWAPIFDKIIYANRPLEVSSDKMIREHSSGEWGRVSSTGAYIKLNQAGRERKVSRIVAKVRRNDIDELTDDQIADELATKINVTPRVALLS